MLLLTVCHIVSKMSEYESLFVNDQGYTRISINQFPKQGFVP